MSEHIADWYERRNELLDGQVFRTHDGSIVRLDRRVAGDGTKWFVADLDDVGFGYWDNTIEPGDLVVLLVSDARLSDRDAARAAIRALAKADGGEADAMLAERERK